MEELAGATEEQRLSRSVEVQDCMSEAKQRVEAGGSAGWEPARCLRNRWRATPEFGLCGEVRQFAPVSNGAPELRRTFYICFIGGLVQMSKLVEHWVEALV